MSDAKIFASALMISDQLENLTSYDDSETAVCDCGFNPKLKTSLSFK
jgi:hypothetical protein